jgi:hypothetical protein
MKGNSLRTKRKLQTVKGQLVVEQLSLKAESRYISELAQANAKVESEGWILQERQNQDLILQKLTF